jgi:hypothetical protein
MQLKLSVTDHRMQCVSAAWDVSTPAENSCCRCGCCSASAAAACHSSSYPHNLRCLSGLVISDSHFLRVSFGDEHGDRLFSSRQEPVDEFYRLMRDVLRQGEPQVLLSVYTSALDPILRFRMLADASTPTAVRQQHTLSSQVSICWT